MTPGAGDEQHEAQQAQKQQQQQQQQKVQAFSALFDLGNAGGGGGGKVAAGGAPPASGTPSTPGGQPSTAPGSLTNEDPEMPDDLSVAKNNDEIADDAAGTTDTLDLEEGKGEGAGGGERDTANASSASKFSHENEKKKRKQNDVNSGCSCCYFDRVWIFTVIITLVGCGVSGAFVAMGVEGAQRHASIVFERQASELVSSIKSAWHDFEVGGLWVHDSCRASPERVEKYIERGICSRNEISSLYEQLKSTGLEVQAICLVLNATHGERPALETESRQYYAEHFPDFARDTYRGFIGFQPDANASKGVSVQVRDMQPFYYNVHLCLPYEGYNFAALDFDIRTSPPRRAAVEAALNTMKPALTERVVLLGDEEEKDGYSVILMHPGAHEVTRSNEVSLVVVRIRSLLSRAFRGQAGDSSVSLYDVTNSMNSKNGDSLEGALFLGSLDVKYTDGGDSNATRTIVKKFLTESEAASRMNGAPQSSHSYVHIADKTWKIVVYDTDYKLDLLFVVLGGVIIFVACIFLAAWYHTSARREKKLSDIRAKSESEKAALIVQNAEKAALAERELNDFIAHEVRNPLASAMTATSFVTSALSKSNPMQNEESISSVREDVGIISSSLSFINDLLRNMLDVHRVANKQMKVELSPTDVQQDILDPISTMLYQRDGEVEIITECHPRHLMVMTDRIRVKQIILNLSNNARKFVTKGFIKIRADIEGGKVHLYVSDSGPGIPKEKKTKLFDKYQESLDSLSQGTGIGLALCKGLSQLMNGDIWLDESYHSGIEGYPGTRFVIDLNAPPLDLSSQALDQQEEGAYDGDGCLVKKNRINGQYSSDGGTASLQAFKLPNKLKILFVDDNVVLRKLFARSVKRIVPNWELEEASNGETALRLVDTRTYDVIFLDQYMASVDKQLLGSETANALRSKGVRSIICGLSANDVEAAFMRNGANAFMFKPFPCSETELTRELVRILTSGPSTIFEDEEAAGAGVGGGGSSGILDDNVEPLSKF